MRWTWIFGICIVVVAVLALGLPTTARGEIIVLDDDGDQDFAAGPNVTTDGFSIDHNNGGWGSGPQYFNQTNAYNGDGPEFNGGIPGPGFAVYTIDAELGLVSRGKYDVYAYWPAQGNTGPATYTVSDGLGPVMVNQTIPAMPDLQIEDPFVGDMKGFQLLGQVVEDGDGVITITLSSDGSNFVLADAVAVNVTTVVPIVLEDAIVLDDDADRDFAAGPNVTTDGFSIDHNNGGWGSGAQYFNQTNAYNGDGPDFSGGIPGPGSAVYTIDAGLGLVPHGTYDVYAYWPAQGNTGPATYTVSDGLGPVEVDQTIAATPDGRIEDPHVGTVRGFQLLGQVVEDGDGVITITLSNDGSNFVLADAVAVNLVSGGVPGDFNKNGSLDAGDLDLQAAQIVLNPVPPPAGYDLNNDNRVNYGDRVVWLHNLKKTWVGDSDLNGLFESADFVLAFQSGKYEVAGAKATWVQGDWDGNQFFTSADFVAAFADGGYEAGPRPAAVSAVPEPSSLVLVTAALGVLTMRKRKSNRP